MRVGSCRKVLAPVATPFTSELMVNLNAFVDHCKWLVGQGTGLAVFGTNSEASSLSVAERMAVLDALVESNVDPKKVVVGAGTCSLPETVGLCRKAMALGCAGVLLLPPFYYKPVSDDGLVEYFSRVIDAVSAAELRVLLYHIPQFTGVPVTLGVVSRLVRAYPTAVVGIKDSSGQWNDTSAFLSEFPEIDVFPSSEALLPRALPLGAAGCISATANIQPRAIVDALKAYDTPRYGEVQQSASAVRGVVQRYPMIPALKAILARHFRGGVWSTVRPPLVALDEERTRSLYAELDQAGLAWPGLEEVAA